MCYREVGVVYVLHDRLPLSGHMGVGCLTGVRVVDSYRGGGRMYFNYCMMGWVYDDMG